MAHCILIQHNYKAWEAGPVLAEAQRRLHNYKNYVDHEKTKENLHIPMLYSGNEGFSSFTDFIKQYKKDNLIKGRFNVDKEKNQKNGTNVMCQSLFTASSDFFAGKSRKEIIDYFFTCADWFVKTYPTAVVISSDIHFDESNPHMHISWLPLYLDDSGVKSFNLKKLQDGKSHFKEMQKDFLDYMNNIGYQFEAFKEGQSYLDLPDFKAKKEALREIDRQIEQKKEIIKKSDAPDLNARQNRFNKEEVIVSKEEYQQVKEQAVLIDEIKTENIELQTQLFNLEMDYEDLSRQYEESKKYQKLYFELKIQFERLKKDYEKIVNFLKKNKLVDKFLEHYKKVVEKER